MLYFYMWEKDYSCYFDLIIDIKEVFCKEIILKNCYKIWFNLKYFCNFVDNKMVCF